MYRNVCIYRLGHHQNSLGSHIMQYLVAIHPNRTPIMNTRDGNDRKILPFLWKSIEKICLSTIIFACPRLDQTYRLVKMGKI